MGAGKGKVRVLSLATLRGGYIDSDSLTDEDLGISSDSYIYDAEYRQMEEERKALIEERKRLEEELTDTIRDSYKPKEDWDSLDKYLYKETGIKPLRSTGISPVSEVQNKQDAVQNRLDFLRDKMQLYASQRGEKMPLSYLPKQVTPQDTKYFNSKKTGMSYYDTFLLENPNYKGYKSYVTMMTPREYIHRVSQQIFGSSYENQVRSIDKKSVADYANLMKKGTKFDIPFLNIRDHLQEGRHRAFAALLLGAEEIPVLIIY